ncbi:MAG: hypothetical protein LBC06_03885 [Rickettsiales bacterium]|nr:hypothetical protein [Rickettsiales bacterium]
MFITLLIASGLFKLRRNV